MSAMLQVGKRVLNLGAIAGANWDGDKLYVYLIGGRYMAFDGEEARRLWQVIIDQGVAVRVDQE